MNNFFRLDGPFQTFMAKIAKLVYVNLLWFIGCIPIITIGASTTALYYTIMRMVRNEEGYLTKDFFQSYKENLLQGSVTFLIGIGTLGILIFNIYHLSLSSNVILRLLSLFSLALTIIFLLCTVYVIPIISHFNTTSMNALKSSMILTARNIHWSLCLVILGYLLPFLILFRFLPLVIFGYSLIVFLQSYILNRIFRTLLPDGSWTIGEEAMIHNKGK